MIHKKISLLNETTLESFNLDDKLAILERFMEAGLKILKADFGFAWWKNGDEYSLAYKSLNLPYTPNYPRERGGNYVAQKTNKPVFVSDVKTTADVIKNHVGPYMDAYVIIPILFKENSYGNMVFCFAKKHIFNKQERSLCVALGNAAAQAITIHRLVKGEQRARVEAEAQQARFRALIENSYDIILLIDATGKILDVSNSATKITGYPVSGLLGKNIGEFVHVEHLPAVEAQMHTVLQNPGQAQTMEFRYRHNDGSWRWMESIGVNMINDDNVGAIVVNVRDVTERKQNQSRIIHQARHDALTSLPNRQEFAARFDQSLATAKRNRRQLAVMFLDMDRFKNVNDQLGHAAGDSLLKVIASRLSSCLRAEDMAARFGGDEFLILASEISRVKDAAVVAEKILTAVALPAQIGEHIIHPSVSIGIAIYPEDGQTLSELKKNADIALYQAKQSGKNRFSFFDHSLNGQLAGDKLAVENELRQALDEHQIVVYYQPIISLKKRKLLAVEALARWQHPGRGLLLPSEFIPLAEQTGLITALDRYVLKTACLQIQSWKALGLPKFRVAVNLSAQQFSENDLVPAVETILSETGAEAGDLEIEITESLAMDNLELTGTNLKALKKLGARLAVDDFGTGYSSLSYLKQFPINSLKIDKSFIRHSITNPRDTSITRTIIAMAHNLNLRVTAEGVETDQQLSLLTRMNCDAAQGFFIHAPMPAEELPGWMEEKKYWREVIYPAPELSTAIMQI